MIKKIEKLDNYLSFINSFYGDLRFSDPHLNEMKEANEDISGWIIKPNHFCFVVENSNEILALFVFIIYENEKYIEMLAGISRDENAVEEMMNYLYENYMGFHADFVFNPNWLLLKQSLKRRGAHFDVEQQRMIYTHKKFDIDISQTVEFSERYKDQYLEIHDKDLYWIGEKVIETPQRFNIFLAIVDDKVVGYIDVTNCFKENEPYSFYVSPDYRRRGIGRSLLWKALQVNEPNEMMLFVDIDNVAAISLYESLGFIKKENANTQTANLEIK